MKKHQHTTLAPLCSFLAVAALLMVAPGQHLAAETITWDTTVSSGNFSTDSNWLPFGEPPEQRAPEPGDTAEFINAGALTVNFTDPETEITRFDFKGVNDGEILPSLTFNLGGNTLDLSGNISNSGLTSSQVQTLTFSGGTVSGSGFVLNGSTITQMVNSRVEANLLNMAYIGGGSASPDSRLYIDADSTLKITSTVGGGSANRSATIGLANGNSASVYIEGGTMEVNNVVTVGGGGASGLLSISDGGSFSGTSLSIGRRGSSGTDVNNPPTYTGEGNLIVTGSGSTATAEQFYIGGGRRGSTFSALGDANGTALFADAGTGNFGLMRIFRTEGMIGDDPVVTRGTLIIDNATVNITGTGTAVIDPDAILRIGLYNPSQAFALNVGGAFTITNANFELFLGDGFSAEINDTFSLINYGSLVGTFAGLDNEDEIVLGGYTFQIDYNLDSAGEIGLLVTAIPEPAAGLAVGLLALLFAIRRARNKVRA